MTKLIASEHDEQAAFFQTAELELMPEYPEVKWLYAVPNQGGSGYNGIRRGIQMVAEGLKSGVSDVCLPVPRWGSISMGQYTGLYIEFKKAPSVSPKRGSVRYHQPSPEQADFIAFARRQGHMAECCNGQDEAFAVLKWYLELEPIPSYILHNGYSFWDNHDRSKL